MLRRVATRTFAKNAMSSTPFSASLVSRSFSVASPMQLFDAIDTDGGGTISEAEYKAAVAKMAEDDLRAFAHMGFRALDHNNDGDISREEFATSIKFMQLNDAELQKLKSSVARNELSSTDGDIDEAPTLNLGKRLQATAEGAISKIFPAGFGWQGGSLIAGNMGLAGTQPAFWACVAVGDALGVMAGHLLWNAAMKAGGRDVCMKQEFHTASLLGTACLFSGGGWQPSVDFFHSTASLPFVPTAVGTFSACTLLFFAGLRFGRMLWGQTGVLSGVAAPSYANLKADFGLSVAVGGATGAFVGTDVSFGVGAEDTNFLRGIVGVEDTTGDFAGMIKAGTSTAGGFTVVQMAQNLAVPAGKNWVD